MSGLPSSVSREDAFQRGAGLVLAHPVEAGGEECLLVALDQKGAHGRRIAIVMRGDRAGFGFEEGLAQGVEHLGGAEPGEAVGEIGQARAEAGLVRAAHQRGHAVGADDHVGIGEFRQVRHRPVEGDSDAFLARLLLQELQQMQPPDRAEADAVEHHALAAMMDRDPAPGLEFRRDGGKDRRIVLLQEFQRAFGKHHAEAEGGIRAHSVR